MSTSRKRSRLSTSCTAAPPTPSSASAALKSSISLLASLDLPHASFSPLLDSLTAAHKALVDWEAQHVIELAEADLRVDTWGWGDLVGVPEEGAVRRVLEDVRAGKKEMDRLGIMTDGEEGLYKFCVTFAEVKSFPRPLLHHNAFLSGTFPTFVAVFTDKALSWPEAGEGLSFEVHCCEASRWPGRWAEKHPEYRLTEYFQSARYILHHPVVDCPANLEPYTMYKQSHQVHASKLREQALANAPTKQDILHHRKQAGERL